MEIAGIIVLIIVLFIFFGLAGWLLKGLGVVFDFLMEGCSTSFGCLFWVFIILVLLLGLLTL